ncbi:fasciclin domain-containing protein [Maribacter sp. 2210JD10-5]|uniref:fasciclin domain-containing protein n=1 Tax=Maribacter sp. 2210JD10-5 TaxID=3386272 RepID=UPI0039BCA0F1
MKKFVPIKNLLALFALISVVLSCEKEEDTMTERSQTKTIVETASGEDALSSLVTALTAVDNLEETDLAGTLSGDGPFTVFAPTNEAFAALLDQLEGFDSLEDFDSAEELEILKTILTYHVVSGVAAKSTDLEEGQKIGTVQGEEVAITLEGGVFIDDATDTNAKVVIPDVEASNGIVHVIDKVLLPQAIIDALNSGMENEEGTLVDVVVATEALSILEAAVIKAGLAETLSSEGPFTVFAPTDEAFIDLLTALGEDYNGLDDFDTEEELALLKDILLFHVIAGAEVKEADLAEGAVETALKGNSVEIIASGETFVIGDASETNANITATDVMASNGVAHTIDKVLLPQSAVDFVATLTLKNIVDIAVATDDLSLLVGALQQADAGLVETLGGEGPFTVFAPTNEAFAELLNTLGDDFNSLSDFDTTEEKALLVKVLTYHVVAGTAAFSTDLSNGQHIETVQGENVGINLKDGTVHIVDATETNATVVTPDVEASNGVVHVINKVLLPQEVLDALAAMSLKTIVEIAVATDDLSLLVGALQQADAGLVETLGGEGPFTVFAPTNEAFAELLNTLGDDYNDLSDFDTADEKALLVDILTYHVVAGTAAFSTDLSNGQHIETFQGENVGIDLKGGTVHIEDATETNATVVTPDVEASNGVVHVINKVLLPQSALDALTPAEPNIVETAQSVADLSLLVDALIQADAGLVEILSGDGPFTVFAPTNAAFADLLDALGDDYHSLADFDTDQEKALLARVLKYHVVVGAAVASTDLRDHQRIETANHGEAIFAIVNHGIRIRDKSDTDANVGPADITTSNGIVHVIDKVLLPQEVVDLLNPAASH